MTRKANTNKPQKNVDNAVDQNPKTNRREFIEKTLKATAGVYVGMTVVDNFVGPKIGTGGMPLNAASGRSKIEGRPPRDGHPGDGIRREKKEKERREGRNKEGRK